MFKPAKSFTLRPRLKTWKQVMLANRALMQLIPRAVDSTDYRNINQFHWLGEEELVAQTANDAAKGKPSVAYSSLSKVNFPIRNMEREMNRYNLSILRLSEIR